MGRKQKDRNRWLENRWIEEWMDRRMDGQKNGWIDKQMDR